MRDLLGKAEGGTGTHWLLPSELIDANDENEVWGAAPLGSISPMRFVRFLPVARATPKRTSAGTRSENNG